MRTAVAGSLLLLPLLAFAVSAADELSESGTPRDWRLLDRVDDPKTGYVIYKRRPFNSDYDAYRLEAVIDAPPAVVAAAARAEMADPGAGPPNAEKTVLRDEGEEVVVYSYADLPLVADRDVVTHARESFDAQNGTHRLEWRATNQEGPGPRKGVVRIEQSSGSWTFSPQGEGRTRVVYETHSDLAGSVPAWMINPVMTDAVVDGLVRLRARIGRNHGSAGQR